MKNRIMLVFFALGFWLTSFGQNTSQLDQYIEQGLKSNLVVQQRSLSLENALNALKQARGLFLPTFRRNTFRQKVDVIQNCPWVIF